MDVFLPVDAQINLKMQNILMLLKRCCNHAYLIEYPLDPTTGDFKVPSTSFYVCVCIYSDRIGKAIESVQ